MFYKTGVLKNFGNHTALLQQLAATLIIFGSVKKSSENVYISLKTKSINTKSRNCLKITEAATGGVPWKRIF